MGPAVLPLRVAGAFVPGDDDRRPTGAVVGAAGQQGRDLRQPVVADPHGTVMGVVALVGDDEQERRQPAVADHGDQPAPTRRTHRAVPTLAVTRETGEVGDRVVPHDVRIVVGAPAVRRHRLGEHPPAAAVRTDLVEQRPPTLRALCRCARPGNATGPARDHREVVGQRGVGDAPGTGSQAAGRGQLVEVGRGVAVDQAAVGVILEHYPHDVVVRRRRSRPPPAGLLRSRSGRRPGRTPGGTPTR